MKLAINGQQLATTHSLEALLNLAQSLKVDGVELWPENLTDDPNGTSTDSSRYESKDVAAAARLIEATGISIACVTLGFHAIPNAMQQGGAPEAALAIQGAVDAAQTLGANIVNCYLAGTPRDMFIAAARPAVQYAAARGIMIVLENEAHDDSATPEQVRAIVEAVGSPFFATEYDPCNYYHAWSEPYPAAYDVLKDHIRYVHLKGGCLYRDGGGEYKGSLMRESKKRIGYLPLPDSAFNIAAIVRRLHRDGYSGYLTLEPHVPAKIALDFYEVELPFLRGLLQESIH